MTEQAVVGKSGTVLDLMQHDDFQAQLEQALANRIPKDFFLRVALTTVRKSPTLMKAHKPAFFAALLEAAQLALPIDGHMGFAHLVPFKDNRRGIIDVTMIPGYRGLMDLAMRGGTIHHMEARLVYEADEFRYGYGAAPVLHHVPYPDWDEHGKCVGAYSIAFYKDGGPSQFHYCPWSLGMQVKARAKARSARSPWNTDPEAMVLKTSMRQLCKWLRVSPEVGMAVTRDEAFEQARWADLSVQPAKEDTRDPSSFAAEVDDPADVGPAEDDFGDVGENGDGEGGASSGGPGPVTVGQAAEFKKLCKDTSKARVAREWLDSQLGDAATFDDLPDADAAEQLLEDIRGA